MATRMGPPNQQRSRGAGWSSGHALRLPAHGQCVRNWLCSIGEVLPNRTSPTEWANTCATWDSSGTLFSDAPKRRWSHCRSIERSSRISMLRPVKFRWSGGTYRRKMTDHRDLSDTWWKPMAAQQTPPSSVPAWTPQMFCPWTIWDPQL